MDWQLSLETERVTAAHPESPLTTTCDAPVAAVLELLRSNHRGAVLVLDGEKVVGIFTERDALRLMARGADLSAPVRTVLATTPASVQRDASVGTAIRRMSDGGYRHLPIVDHTGRPSGMVTVRGILRYLVEHFPDTIYNLPPASTHSSQLREGA